MIQGMPNLGPLNLGPLKNYVELATGLTEVTANKAKEAAMALISQGVSLGSRQPADVAASVQQAADDLVALSKTNRDMLIDMIRSEVDRAVGRMGFVREEELAALRARIERVEKEVAEQHAATEPKQSELAPESSPSSKKKKVIVNE
jgi:polyhydroxyalkanoate synthesis regulator phasin